MLKYENIGEGEAFKGKFKVLERFEKISSQSHVRRKAAKPKPITYTRHGAMAFAWLSASSVSLLPRSRHCTILFVVLAAVRLALADATGTSQGSRAVVMAAKESLSGTRSMKQMAPPPRLP